MPQLDLTPFGFTPTESIAYKALIERGPMTGYGLAHALSIARANAYQAVRGLVAKGAVVATVERPERYRPLQPGALLALITEREARMLDRLEASLAGAPPTGGPGIVQITGERAALDLALRTAARALGPLTCIAPPRLLLALAPAWHKRALDRAATDLWSLGEAPQPPLPIELAGLVDPETAARRFTSPVLLLCANDGAMVVSLAKTGPMGYWTSASVLVEAIRAAATTLTGKARALTQSPAEQ